MIVFDRMEHLLINWMSLIFRERRRPWALAHLEMADWIAHRNEPESHRGLRWFVPSMMPWRVLIRWNSYHNAKFRFSKYYPFMHPQWKDSKEIWIVFCSDVKLPQSAIQKKRESAAAWWGHPTCVRGAMWQHTMTNSKTWRQILRQTITKISPKWNSRTGD